MNKLTEVLQAIRDANPETMKLSFGCEVFVNVEDAKKYGNESSLINMRGQVVGNNSDGLFVYNGFYIKKYCKTQSPFKGENCITKIIGHPLHIGHLLKALEKFAFDKAPLLTCEGQLADYNPETGSLHLTGVFVNPTQPLETQLKENPELVDTLHTLIVK